MLDEVNGSPNQATPPDSGLLALVMLSRFHSVAADPEQLRHEFSVGGAPFGTDEILHGAGKLGLKAKLVRTTRERLTHTPLPAIAQSDDGRIKLAQNIAKQWED